MMRWDAPLYNIHCELSRFAITDYLSIEPNELAKKQKLDNLFFSEQEKIFTSMCGFCAVIEDDKIPEYISTSVSFNILLLSFWLFAPTKLQMRVRISESGEIFRLRDYLQYNPNEKNTCEFDERQLLKIRNFYISLLRVFMTKKRLYTAMQFTYQACVSNHWMVAFVLHVASLEAILTYERGHGISKRLADACSLLLMADQESRVEIYDQFRHLYDIRSDIMHGRLTARKKATNLENLVAVSDLARRAWVKILTNAEFAEKIESDDNIRKGFFKTLRPTKPE